MRVLPNRSRRLALQLALATPAFGLWRRAAIAADAKPFRIGFVEAGAPSANQHFVDAFKRGLRDLGYVEGTSVVIDVRWAEGRQEQFPQVLAELVKLQPDVLVVASSAGAVTAKKVVTSIPVVFVGVSDPVGLGLVSPTLKARSRRAS